jgi:hypothetical protein
MTVATLNTFIWGASAAASWAIGLFFLRFWRDTRDRLFAFFALSFFMMAVNRVGLAVQPADEREPLYWIRFLAFALILIGILDKNVRREPPPK